MACWLCLTLPPTGQGLPARLDPLVEHTLGDPNLSADVHDRNSPARQQGVHSRPPNSQYSRNLRRGQKPSRSTIISRRCCSSVPQFPFLFFEVRWRRPVRRAEHQYKIDLR